MTPIEMRARREALGLSQVNLASILGVSQATVSRWEKGDSPIPSGVDASIGGVEVLADELIDNAAAAVELAPDRATLFTFSTDSDFWAAHPEADGMPASVHRAAMAAARRLFDESIPIAEFPDA